MDLMLRFFGVVIRHRLATTAIGKWTWVRAIGRSRRHTG